jgi:hypothetical protein
VQQKEQQKLVYQIKAYVVKKINGTWMKEITRQATNNSREAVVTLQSAPHACTEV